MPAVERDAVATDHGEGVDHPPGADDLSMLADLSCLSSGSEQFGSTTELFDTLIADDIARPRRSSGGPG